MAQVAGLRPALKYDQWTYEICARVIGSVCGQTGYDEFIRRLVFMIASGNTDAHLKNWSLLYPDGINAVLTPLYDQVAVVSWPPPQSLKMEWALKFAGTKNLFHIDEDAFIRLANRSGGNSARVKALLDETLTSIIEAWQSGGIAELLPSGHAQALRQYWLKQPLLRDKTNNIFFR